MNKKILIITSSFDITCDYLIDKYSYIDFVRINVDQFPDYEFVVSESGIEIKTINWACNFREISAIYYRKPSLPDFTGILDSQYHTFAHKEIFALIEGMVESFDGTCLSKPSILRRANNKIVQCLLAREIGFNFPSARITNAAKKSYPNKDKRTIVKPISIGAIENNDSKITVQTNIVDTNIPMDTLKYCPAYFQEYVDKDYDLRITYVGEDFFPVKINSFDKVDWRKNDNIVSYEIVDVPEDVMMKCKKMLDILNLKFGCFDFVVKNNVYFFLEVNANGQWAWLEKELGLSISSSIVKELL